MAAETKRILASELLRKNKEIDERKAEKRSEVENERNGTAYYYIGFHSGEVKYQR